MAVIRSGDRLWHRELYTHKGMIPIMLHGSYLYGCIFETQYLVFSISSSSRPMLPLQSFMLLPKKEVASAASKLMVRASMSTVYSKIT